LGCQRFFVGLVGLFGIDYVGPEDGSGGADDGCVGVVDEDDDLGSGVAASDAEVEHPVGVAE
jgi:hypothetical protein